MARTERDLFRLRKVLVHTLVQDELPNGLERNEVLRPDLCRVQNVELKFVLVLLRNNLNGEGPLGEGTGLDSLLEILSMKICHTCLDQ